MAQQRINSNQVISRRAFIFVFLVQIMVFLSKTNIFVLGCFIDFGFGFWKGYLLILGLDFGKTYFGEGKVFILNVFTIYLLLLSVYNSIFHFPFVLQYIGNSLIFLSSVIFFILSLDFVKKKFGEGEVFILNVFTMQYSPPVQCL